MVFLIGLFVGGIFLLSKNKKLAIIMLLIPISFTLFIIGLYFWFSHQTTTDSITLNIIKVKQQYVINGFWKERFDPYSLGTDLLVFYLPDNKKVKLDYIAKPEKKISPYPLRDAINIISKNPNSPSQLKPQIFKTNLEKNFEVKFSLPTDINLNDVIIQYVHIKEDPMEPTFYWVKTYKANKQENKNFFR